MGQIWKHASWERTYSTRGQTTGVSGRGRDRAREILPRRASPLMFGSPSDWLIGDRSGIHQRNSSPMCWLPGTRLILVCRLGRIVTWRNVCRLGRGGLQDRSRVFILVDAGVGRVDMRWVRAVGRGVFAR